MARHILRNPQDEGPHVEFLVVGHAPYRTTFYKLVRKFHPLEQLEGLSDDYLRELRDRWDASIETSGMACLASGKPEATRARPSSYLPPRERDPEPSTG